MLLFLMKLSYMYYILEVYYTYWSFLLLLNSEKHRYNNKIAILDKTPSLLVYRFRCIFIKQSCSDLAKLNFCPGCFRVFQHLQISTT